MSDLTAKLRQRLANRPDSEHGQALVRLVIAVLIVTYMVALRLASGKHDAPTLLLVMLAEAMVGLGLFVAIVINPGVSHVRRWIGMVADYTTLATLLSLQPRAMAPFYVIILWVTIGNGLRFGTAYLYSAAALACASFTVPVLTAEYWRQQPSLATGLWLGLLAIPMYFSSLLRSLHRATQEAKRANEAKSQFLANMSHELRSPLNGIIGMAELMQGTRMTQEQREYAEVILTSAQSLLLVVSDVLDISAIEAGKLDRRDDNFNLQELVQRLQKMLQPLAATKGVAFRVNVATDVPVRLCGDAARLTQILLNLLHNAVKFTEQGSVTLDVQRISGSQTDARLRFSVRDTGIGIPPEDLDRIFLAFEQVDAGPTRRFGGTGLGTTIAKTLTQLLGGDIGVEANPGGGSHFWVELPLQLQEDEPAAVAIPANNDKIISFDDPFIRHRTKVRNLRVLIADDLSANRTVLARILERAGHRVVTVEDGEQALDQLESGQFDLAILDMHMPQVSGLDVIRQLQFMEARSPKRTPCIVLSADATMKASEEADRAGAKAFLTKPIVVGKLLETIASVVDSQKLPAVRAISDITRPVADPMVLEELAAMGLGEKFLRDFVDQCFLDAGKCQRELGEMAATGNWSEFREVAHAYKGIAGNIGASGIVERCSQIMKANDDVLVREHAKLIADLSVQLSAVIELTRQEVSRLTGSGRNKDVPDIS